MIALGYDHFYCPNCTCADCAGCSDVYQYEFSAPAMPREAKGVARWSVPLNSLYNPAEKSQPLPDRACVLEPRQCIKQPMRRTTKRKLMRRV